MRQRGLTRCVISLVFNAGDTATLGASYYAVVTGTLEVTHPNYYLCIHYKSSDGRAARISSAARLVSTR